MGSVTTYACLYASRGRSTPAMLPIFRAQAPVQLTIIGVFTTCPHAVVRPVTAPPFCSMLATDTPSNIVAPYCLAAVAYAVTSAVGSM